MTIRTASGVLALVAGMVSAPHALADVQGQATVGNLRVTLFDLDLTDAVTPSITLSSPQGSRPVLDLGMVSMSYLADSYRYSEHYGKHVTASHGIPETLAYRHGSHAQVEATYLHPTAFGQAAAVSARLGAAGQHEFTLSGMVSSDTLDITLSPNTRAVFHADLAFSGTTSALSSHTQALLFNAAMHANDVHSYEYTSDSTSRAIGTRDGLALAIDDSDILSVDYSNTGTTARAGQLYFYLELTGHLEPVSPVPEPSSAAMLLAGAALLGWRRAGLRNGRGQGQGQRSREAG